MSLVDENMNIKFHMLEAITKNFADEMKVGSGAFGIVYKVCLIIEGYYFSLLILCQFYTASAVYILTSY
jgi:hypothetical protein